MEITSQIGLLGSIASITGYSLREVTRLAGNRRHARLLIQTAARYLAVHDRTDDGIVGMWTLEKLDYDYELHRHWYVTGNLAVLYAPKARTNWQCQMFLEYRRFHSGVPGLPANGCVAHLLGTCVTAVYDVAITRKPDGKMEGQSSMVQVFPSRHIKDQGLFESLRVDGERLVGDFRNTNTTGRGTFTFFMRKRWHQVASCPDL